MSIEEKFEKWISKKENIERVILKALPVVSSGFLVASLNLNTKAWKYAFLSYAGVFTGTYLVCKYVKFKERVKRYDFRNFIKYVVGLYGTREKV